MKKFVNKMKLANKIKQIYLDINNFQKLNEVIKKEKPEIIFHLAAQSIVSLSYLKRLQTIKTNTVLPYKKVTSQVSMKNLKSHLLILWLVCLDMGWTMENFVKILLQ